MRNVWCQRVKGYFKKPKKNNAKHRKYLNKKQERIIRLLLWDVYAQKPFHQTNQENTLKQDIVFRRVGADIIRLFLFKFNLRNFYILSLHFILHYKTMTMKQRKHLASLVGICGILSILGWCTQDTTTTETIQPTNTLETTEPTVHIDETTTMNETNVQQQLVINPWCIWCGRCMQIAPNNFTMGGRHAHVISQENLDSLAVQQAINICPVQVIEIVEA